MLLSSLLYSFDLPNQIVIGDYIKMNIMEKRELQQYGFQAGNNYDVALKMLKSFRCDEFRTLSSPQEVGTEPPVFACRFCKVFSYEHILALANEDGKIAIQNTALSRTEQSSNTISCTQGHMNAIFDLAWSPHSLRLVSVSGDHTAILWDVSGRSLAPLGIFEGHSRSVKVATFHPTDINVFATGARDGMVIMWDYRCIQQNATTIKPDNVISNAHCQSGSSAKKTKRREPSRADSITGLVYQDDNHLISCSAGDGVIKVWDTRKCYSVYRRVPQPCYSLPHPGDSAKTAFTSLSVDPGGVRLFANCMDNHIYCYNIASYQSQPVAKYVGHQNQTFYIKSCLSGDGQYLVSGSTDEKAYVWSVRRPGAPLAALVGHTAEVTCVDWAENVDGDIKMVTCADDSCHRLWRVKPPTDSESDKSDLVGWTEWLHKSTSITSLTPRAIKRMVSRQERTPGYVDDTKRQKTEALSPIEEGHERQVLAAVQPRTEVKGARRLFDIECSSHCTGVEILSPTSNLPNYVIEGTSPYHRCCSSASKQKENWLVKLQATPSPKQAEKLTIKRKSQSTPKVCRGNLLKFFKVAAKQSPVNVTNGCEAQKEMSLVKESPTVLS